MEINNQALLTLIILFYICILFVVCVYIFANHFNLEENIIIYLSGKFLTMISTKTNKLIARINQKIQTNKFT